MDVAPVVPVVWIGGWIAASVAYRRVKGKPIVSRIPAAASFGETGASGRSLRNAMTRLGGARNCLLVQVADGELRVVPCFPFTLMFLPELLGLELRVPLGSIAAVRRIGRSVRIIFTGATPPLELTVRDEEGLRRQLEGGALGGSAAPSASSTPAPRRRFRLIAFRMFLALWGTIALGVASSGLADDWRFRRDGVETAGVFDGPSADAPGRNDQGVLAYVVDGRRYHLTSLQGPGLYTIGGTATL